MTESPYKARVREQTRLWCDSISRHNAIDDECCPDFSCCHPELFEKDEAKRRAYYAKHHGSN